MTSILLMAIGVGIASSLWLTDEYIYKMLVDSEGLEDGFFYMHGALSIRVAGSLLFVFLCFPLCFCFDKNVRIWSLALVIGVSAFYAQIFEAGLLSEFLSYVTISTLGAGLIQFVFSKKS